MKTSLPSRRRVVGLLLAALTSVVATWPAQAGAAGVSPQNVCASARLAPSPLASDPDRNPDGSIVRTAVNRDGGFTPVLMVHGWSGQATHDVHRSGAFSHKIDLTANRLGSVTPSRSLIGQLQRVGGTAVYTFDYHAASGRWVSDPAIGPALGRAIDCLARTYHQKVIVVGHSMGGLAARWALTEDGHTSRQREVSQVITFGTPETGSVAAFLLAKTLDLSTAAALGLKQSDVGPAVGTLRALLAECGRESSRSFDPGGVCGALAGPLRAFDGQAGRALRAESEELAALRTPAVPFHALGGDTRFAVPSGSGWFAIPFKTTDVDGLGDLVVTPASAGHGAVDSDFVRCRYQLNPLRGTSDAVGLRLKLTAAADVAESPLGALAGPCFHSSLMRSIELTNQALGLVADDVDSRTATRASDLLHAPVRALCNQRAGTLTNGRLGTFGSGDGGDLFTDHPSDGVTGHQLVDVTGEGVKDAAAIIQCNAGGVPWSENIEFYTGGSPSLLGGLTLSTISHGDRDFVTGWEPIHGGVHVRWEANRDTDYGCCPTKSWEADLVWDGARVVARRVAGHDELPTVRTFLDAARRRDVATMEKYADASVAAPFAQGAPTPVGGDAICYGSPATDTGFPREVAEAAGGAFSDVFGTEETDNPRYCVVPQGLALPAILVVSMTGWNQWRVSSYIDLNGSD